MPTYVYKCGSCQLQFEQFQSFKEDALKVCLCGKEGAVRRVIQPTGIVFKGSGWYITDSRKSESASAKASESIDGESKPAAEAATESKPATEAASDAGASKSADTPTSGTGSTTKSESSTPAAPAAAS